jgi:hypothetical protein
MSDTSKAKTSRAKSVKRVTKRGKTSTTAHADDEVDGCLCDIKFIDIATSDEELPAAVGGVDTRKRR